MNLTGRTLARGLLPLATAFAPLASVFAGACSGPPALTELSYEIEQTLVHDAEAYTQGLIVRGGAFFESTGRLGHSELREVDVATGRVVRSRALPDTLFGEGLAMVGDKLVQLTWKAGLAFVYDTETFEVADTLRYEGEGWGLCYDGVSLFMSNGSGTLTRRDPATFQVQEEIRVTKDGFSVRDLNELECVGEHVWANVYLSDHIYRIDKGTGQVTGELDAYGLTVASGRPADAGAVLNGIAYDETDGNFYLTGKLWPAIFRVRIAGD